MKRMPIWRRAYLIGFTRGFRRAANEGRQELREMAADFELKVNKLHSDYQQLLRDLMSEARRHADLERALNTRRDDEHDHFWLN